jgi:hypothetical protein
MQKRCTPFRVIHSSGFFTKAKAHNPNKLPNKIETQSKMKLSITSTVAMLLTVAKTDAAASFDPSIVCDPSSDSDVCRGSLEFYSPSPVMIDDGDGNFHTVYKGGWHWFYSFVRGLPDGYVDYSGSYGEYEYGPDVYVSMDDDMRSCKITVGTQECNSCERCSFVEPPEEVQNASFKADCTNIEATAGAGPGLAVECASTSPFFFPMEIPRIVTEGPTPGPTPGFTRPRRPNDVPGTRLRH